MVTAVGCSAHAVHVQLPLANNQLLSGPDVDERVARPVHAIGARHTMTHAYKLAHTPHSAVRLDYPHDHEYA